MNWTDWSALGRDYKDEKGLAGNKYKDWTYYTIDPAKMTRLTGLDSNAGQSKRLYHMPTNHEFGFQVGEAANNKNTEYGISGWFFYRNYRGNWTQGDINMNLENCDDSNQNCDVQVREWTGDVIICYRGTSYCVDQLDVNYYLYYGATLGRCDTNSSHAIENTIDKGSVNTENNLTENTLEVDKAPEVSINAYPNPTSGIANITFTVSEAGPVNVGIYSTKGLLIGTVYQGDAEANTEYKVVFDGTNVTEGVYLIRLRTAGYLETKKLMIKK